MAVNDQIWSGAAADNDFDAAGNYDVAEAPESGDTIIAPALAADSTKDIAGQDASAILLAAFTVEPNCFLNFGSRITPLQLDTDAFTYAGGANAFFDLTGVATVRVDYAKAASGAFSYGLHLAGATMALADIDPGSSGAVGIAALEAATATITTLKLLSGDIEIGLGLTCTTLYALGADIISRSAVTTGEVQSGTWRQEVGAIATINLRADGKLFYNATALPTTINLYDGATLDLSERGTTFDLDGKTLNVYGSEAIINDPQNRLLLPNATVNKFLGGEIRFG